MTQLGTLFIISAPSGAGKTTLVRKLVAETPNLEVSISHTTRVKRPGEVDGDAYHFVEETEFNTMSESGLFLEHAKVFGHYYGTSKEWVEAELAKGIDIILEIDWQGAAIINKQMDDVATIFIMPPSRETLASRLVTRGQDDDNVIHARMEQAVSEMSHYQEYDYMVVNEDLATAYSDLQAIIRAERLKENKQSRRHKELIKKLLD